MQPAASAAGFAGGYLKACVEMVVGDVTADVRKIFIGGLATGSFWKAASATVKAIAGRLGTAALVGSCAVGAIDAR